MTDISNNYQTQNLQGNVNWTMTAAYHIHYHPPHTHTATITTHTARLMRHKNTTHTTQKYRSHTTHTQPALYITQWNGSATRDLPSCFVVFAVVLDLGLEVMEPLGLYEVYLLVLGGGALSGVLDRETVAVIIIVRIVQ